jgi:hypothetical protein
LLESLRSMNMEIPTLTSATTTYLYGLNLRRYSNTLRRRTGMSLQDCVEETIFRVCGDLVDFSTYLR